MEQEKKVKLKLLEADIQNFGSTLKGAAETIQTQNVSNYPIFVAHQYTVGLGIELIDRGEHSSNWSFNASTLEEMVAKNVVTSDKIDSFRAIYKSPETFICVFVLDETGAEFVFYPYEETTIGNAVSDD